MLIEMALQELSIGDWKRVLNSGATRQMHPKELQALNQVVAAADQARNAQSRQQLVQIKPHLDAVMDIAKQLTNSGMPVQMAQTSTDTNSPRKRSPAKPGSSARQSPGRLSKTILAPTAQEKQHVRAQPLHQRIASTDQGLQQGDADWQDKPKQQLVHTSEPSHKEVTQPSKGVEKTSSKGAGATQQQQQQQQQHVPAARRVLIDQQQKWQRISDWIARDSAAATSGSQSATEGNSHPPTPATARSVTAGEAAKSSDADGAATAPHSVMQSPLPGHDADTIVSMTDMRYSLETAMMELELARNRTSVPHIAQDQQQPQLLYEQAPQVQHEVITTEQHDGPPNLVGLHSEQNQQPQAQQQSAQLKSENSPPSVDWAGDPPPMQLAAAAHTAEAVGPLPLQQSSAVVLAKQQLPAQRLPVIAPEALAVLQEQLQQEKQLRQQEQQLLLDQQRMVAELQQQVQQLLQQQAAVAAEHREQLQEVQTAAASEREQAKQLLERERQQLRIAAADVLGVQAQQQAATLQEQQKCKGLQQQLQQAGEDSKQQREELQRLRAKVSVLEEQQRQDEAQQKQLSARLKEAVDQKQELRTKVTSQLQELQQQLEECRTALMQSAADKASLTAKLAAADRAKADLEGRLELAAAEVTQMRDVIGQMAERLEARDKAVSAHVREFQQQQLSAQQHEMQEAQAALQATTASANALRNALLAIHTALSPQSISAALGRQQIKGPFSAGFKLDAEQYEALSGRLLGLKVIAAADADAVAERVRKLLAQVCNTVLSYERAEAAASTEAQSAVELLQQELIACNTARQQLLQQQQEAESKLATAGEALATATDEIEQLTNALQAATARQHKQVLDTDLAKENAQLRDELETCKAELAACQQQLQISEQEQAACGEAANAQHQKLQDLDHELQDLRQQLESSQQAAEAKDERIKELRATLGDLLQAKQDLEASLGMERSSVQQAMAMSQQQQQKELDQQLATLQRLQQEHQSLELQLESAQAELLMTQNALQKAHDHLQQLLIQVQSAAEEAVSAIQVQTQEYQQQQQLPLCHQLQQQLAKELARLPRMASESISTLESAVPVMLQLPQLIVSVLRAIMEQHSAEQAHQQKVVHDLSWSAADAAAAISAAVQQLTSKQQQQQLLPMPDASSNHTAAKQQLQEAVVELQSSVTAVLESAAQQGTQIVEMQTQVARLQTEADEARSAQGAADNEAQVAREQLSAAKGQVGKLQADLQLVLETTQRKRADLEAQLLSAQQALALAQEAARQQQKQHEQASAAFAADLAAVQQTATADTAALQEGIQQLQQKLEAAACHLVEKDNIELRLHQSSREVASLQHQLSMLREQTSSAAQQMAELTKQQHFLVVQAGQRLRATKRATRTVKAVRARRYRLLQFLLNLKGTTRQQQQQLRGQQQQVETLTVRLRKLQQERESTLSKLSTAEAKVQELQVKSTRAEGLAAKLEERCSKLGTDKRSLQGQVAELQAQVATWEEKRKMFVAHTTSAQSQADAANKEAKRMKSQCSNFQQSQQQLYEQLLEAEAGLRCSRETNSMLLTEGQRLELQVRQLTEELQGSRQKLSSTASSLIQAQEEIINLQNALLQKTAVAEAAQAQLAAAVLLQSAEQAATNAAAASTAGAANRAVDACRGLAAVMQQPLPGVSRSVTPAESEGMQGTLCDDPKCQRICELRAALAAALTDATSAAEPAHEALNSKQQPVAAVPQAILGLASMQFGQCGDPKMLRIQELTLALLSAAGDAAAAGHVSPGCTLQSADAMADDDIKTKRLQELRAALAETMKERDELKQQLAGSSNMKLHNALFGAQMQLTATQKELDAGQDGQQLRDQLTNAHTRLSELEAALHHAAEQQQQLKPSEACAEHLQLSLKDAQEASMCEQQRHEQLQHRYHMQTRQLEHLQEQVQRTEQQLSNQMVGSDKESRSGSKLLEANGPGGPPGHQQVQQDPSNQAQADVQLQVQQSQEQLDQAQSTIQGLQDQVVVVLQLQQQVQQLQQALDDAQQQLRDSDKQLQVLEELETTWLAEKAALDAKVAQLQQAMLALGHTTEVSAAIQHPPVVERSWQSTDVSTQYDEEVASEEPKSTASANMVVLPIPQQDFAEKQDNMQALQKDLEAARLQTGLPACTIASSLASAHAELDEARHELEQQNTLVAELRQQLHSSQQQLKAFEQNTQHLERLLCEKQQLLQDLQDAQVIANQADPAVVQHGVIGQEDAQLQHVQHLQNETEQQLAEAQAAAAAAQEDARQLRQALQVAEAHAAVVAEGSATVQVDQQQLKLESLQQQLAQSKAEVQGLQKQLQQLEAAKEDAIVQLDKYAADVTELRSELSSARAQQEASDAARTLVEQELQLLQHRWDEQQQQLQTVQKDLANADEVAAGNKLEADAALVRYQEACQKLAMQTAAATALEHSIKVLEQKLVAAEQEMHSQVTSLQKHLSHLQQQLADEQSRSEQMQLQLEDLQAQLEAQQQQHQDADYAGGQQNKHLQQALEFSRQELASLQQQVLEANSEGSTLGTSNVAQHAAPDAPLLAAGELLQQQQPVFGQQQQQQGPLAEDSMQSLASTAGAAAAAAHHSELAKLAMELAQSKRELQAAQKTAAQWQEQASQVRRNIQQYSAAQHAVAGKQQASDDDTQGADCPPVVTSREAALAAENRDLVVRLSATHKKLKLLRSRSQQREALQEAKVRELEHEKKTLISSHMPPRCSEAEASLHPASSLQRPSSSDSMVIADDGQGSAYSMQAEVEAYKKALYAAQEEAAAAISSAAEARAQAEALTTAMEMQSRREAFRRQTSKRLLCNNGAEVEENAESSLHEVAATAAGEDGDVDFAALAGRLVAQQQQIMRLASELEMANAKRAELARVNALLTQQLADHDHMMRALRHEASDMAQQLSLAQESIAHKEKIIEQLKELCNRVDLAGLQLALDGSSVQRLSGSSTPSYGPGSSDKRELSRQSSKGLASQHAVGKIASAWKESSKMKDLRIEELTFQLGQVTAQLDMARRETDDLQQQLASSKAEASAGAAALAAAQSKAASQLQILDSQLANKGAGLAAAEARLQALETELHSANNKAASLQKHLELSESEVAHLKEAAAAAVTRLSACQEELTAARQDASSKQQALEAAKQDVTQAVSAVTSERQQLSQLQSQVGKLATVLRQLLASVSSSATVSSILDAKPGTAPVKALSDLVDLVAAELTRRLRDAAAAASRIADLEARLADRAEEVAQLQGTLKAQTDKIFSQQAALGKSQEELRSLKAQLEKQAAQQEVIEAEIARQVEEYGRLKKQLVDQEELQAALATKTEQLSYAASRCSELELQLARALEQAAANSQKFASLKVAADSAARAQAEAAVQRQEALANLEVARAELERVQQQLALAQAAAEKKGQEVRELNHMLKAWEAMRLGKDAQIAALMERCKRNEEEAAEKARTVEALRRKLALAGRPGSSGSGSIALGSTFAGHTASYSVGAGSSGMVSHHAAPGALAGPIYTGGGIGQGSPVTGVSALRRSWAAESAGFGGSPAGSPTRSLGSYGPFS